MASALSSGLFTLRQIYNKGVLRLPPSVLVNIGGSLTTTVIAPVSEKDDTVSFNDGITAVNSVTENTIINPAVGLGEI